MQPANLVIDGTVTLSGGGTVGLYYGGNSPSIINSKIISNGASATLINVDNTIIDSAGTIGDANLTLINEANGEIIAAIGYGTPVVIDTGTNVITNAGQIDAQPQGTLHILSPINNSGQIQAMFSGASVDLLGAAVNSGVIHATDFGVVDFFDTVTNTALIQVDFSGRMDFFGRIANAGRIEIFGADSTLNIENTIANSNLVLATAGAELSISGAVLNSGTTEANGAGSVVNIQHTLANSGFVDAIDSGLLNISGPLSNLGTIKADGGTVDIAASISGNGSLGISNYGMMVLGTPCAEDVTFAGTGNTLVLAQPWSFTGHLAGLAPGDTIDFALTTIISATINGQMLGITESGGQTLTYQLGGPVPAMGLMLQGDGAGGTDLIFTVAPPLRFVGIGDFNGDSRSDIAWVSNGGAQATLWMNNNGTLTQFAVPGAAMGEEWTAYGVGDFNNDGNADLLWTNTSGQAAIWEMNGSNLIGFGIPAGQMGAEWHVAGIGDFNGDSKSDILWVGTSGQAAVWTMNGLSLAGFAISNGAMGAEWSVLGTGDFNQDGRSDVLWENTSGNVDIWEMNGATVSGAAIVGTAPANSHFGGVGHFTGAGGSTSDIVWVDSTNQVRIWQMKNGTITNTITPNGLDGSDWHLEGVGNFAGDANSDLLWINNNGAVNIWQLNGSQVTSTIANAPTGNSLQLKAGTQPAANMSSPVAGATGTQASDPPPQQPAANVSSPNDVVWGVNGGPGSGPAGLWGLVGAGQPLIMTRVTDPQLSMGAGSGGLLGG